MDFIHTHQALTAFFNDVDVTDVKTIEAEVSLRSFIAGMLSYYPWWIVMLYRVREVLVRTLGLVRHEMPEESPVIAPENLAFEPGRNATFFIVHTAREDTYWVAETPPDKHLKAYFGVAAEPLGGGRTRFHVFTTVEFLHWTGPVYYNLIRPFHHLVVSAMMRAGSGRKAHRPAC